MFRIFARKAAPQSPVHETGVLDTRHGPVNMSRVQTANAVAYVCHTSKQAADAVLDVRRVTFVAIDRNQGGETDNILSEKSDYGKSDYVGAAENMCNSAALMEKAVIIVFFDHVGDKSGTASDVLKQVRDRFPATNPSLDCLELPQEPFRPRLRLVKPDKPAPPQDFHYSC